MVALYSEPVNVVGTLNGSGKITRHKILNEKNFVSKRIKGVVQRWTEQEEVLILLEGKNVVDKKLSSSILAFS